METPMTYKAMFQSSLLNDLPTELKYRILDFLDGTSLKKCRLLNQTYLKLINNCEKYNKHWILDISNIPIDSNQEIVRIFSRSSMNFGRLCGQTNIFVWDKTFFEKLGKSVTYIKDIRFEHMDLDTTKAFVKTFDKVQDLKLLGNTLLYRMQQMGLTWPSVKRLTVFCAMEDSDDKYKGNFSEFPNVEEITLEYFNLMMNAAFKIIRRCPKKITGLRDKVLILHMHDPFPKLNEMKNLSLKRIKSRYAAKNEQDAFLMAQTGITKYEFYAKFHDSLDYYYAGKVLPDFIDPTRMHALTLEMTGDTELDLNSLDAMTNLKKFSIILFPGFKPYQSFEEQMCFLSDHDVHENLPCVTHLSLDPRQKSQICNNCIRTLLLSFTRITELSIGSINFESMKKFNRFWRILNENLMKRGVSQHLSLFHLSSGDFGLEINCEACPLFDVMKNFPQLKTLELQMYLTKVSQKNLEMLCDKCPSLQRLNLGTGCDLDLNLCAILIRQLQYLKYLKISDMAYMDENHEEFAATPDLIQTLLNTPLKLLTFELPFNCKTEELFPLFEKFPMLRELQVTVKDAESDEILIHPVYRNEYYDKTK